MELCERFVDHGRLQDLFKGVVVLKLRVWVALGVFMVDTCNFSKVFGFGAVPLDESA